MVTRRDLLVRTLGIGALGAGGWWLWRHHVRWPEPEVLLPEGAEDSGELTLARGPDNLPITTVSVEGRPVRALIDSGAQYTVVDRALADALDLPTDAAPPVLAFGLSGAPTVGRAARASLAVGPVTLERVRAAVLDLPTVGGRGFELILGRDVLGVLGLVLDFPRRRVLFHRSGARERPEGAQDAPLSLRAGAPYTVAEVEDAGEIELLFDTGASAAVALSRPTAEASGLLDGRPTRQVKAVTLGGLTVASQVAARRVGFAGGDYRDVPVQVFEPPRAPMAPQGLMGVGLFGPYRLGLDLGAGRLWVLRPGGRAPGARRSR